MSPRFVRSLFALALVVTTLAIAAPAQAGPPLLCHPFDIGDAKSLPWDGATGLSTGRADYAIDRLVADTEALLVPATPAIVRMETLRRAAIYASRDRQVATRLLDRLTARVQASEQAGTPDPLAMLDAAYVTEAYRQIGMMGRNAGFGDRPSNARAVVGALDGTTLMAKCLAARPDDAALAFAAALMAADKNRSAYEAHARKARAGAASDPLLRRNLNHIS
jgi:hypothetical protein